MSRKVDFACLLGIDLVPYSAITMNVVVGKISREGNAEIVIIAHLCPQPSTYGCKRNYPIGVA